MYCSSCGIDSVEGLKYCKRCGAKLTETSAVIAPKRLPLALTGLVLLVMGGIAALGLSTPLLMARDLVNSGFMPKQVLLLFFLSSVAAVAIIALLLPVLMRLISMVQNTESPSSRPEHSIDPPRISGPPHSVASVTEGTTRSFEPRRFEDTQV